MFFTPAISIVTAISIAHKVGLSCFMINSSRGCPLISGWAHSPQHLGCVFYGVSVGSCLTVLKSFLVELVDTDYILKLTTQ